MSSILDFPEPPNLTLEERTMRALLTDAAMLDESAFCLFKSLSPHHDGLTNRALWDGMREDERQVWRDRTIASTEVFLAMRPAERELASRNSLMRIIRKNDEAFARHRASLQSAVESPSRSPLPENPQPDTENG